MKMKAILLTVLAVLVLGCASSYSWRSKIPRELRTVNVPTFQNSTEVLEVGTIATRQLLREFQREGTFTIAGPDEAAIEIQGEITSVSSDLSASSRRFWSRIYSGGVSLKAKITVVDRLQGVVLINNKTYDAQTTTSTGQDRTSGLRDASGRLADDLARQIVDDILNLKW